MPSPLWFAVDGLVPLPLILAGYYAYGPISRSRLEAFARHHDVRLTVANGNQVIRYLAITRRWRCAGVGVGATIVLAWGLPEQRVSVNVLALVAGWFAGALIAELHLAAAVHGPRRVASLQPRTPQRYVSAFVWRLLPIGAIAALLAIGVGVVRGQRGELVDWPRVVLWAGLAAAVVLVVAAVRRKVLVRAQQPDSAEAVHADDAIRSRSLHVLSAGGFALATYFALAVFTEFDGLQAVAPIGSLIVLIVGVLSANARRSAPAAIA